LALEGVFSVPFLYIVFLHFVSENAAGSTQKASGFSLNPVCQSFGQQHR